MNVIQGCVGNYTTHVIETDTIPFKDKMKARLLYMAQINYIQCTLKAKFNSSFNSIASSAHSLSDLLDG